MPEANDLRIQRFKVSTVCFPCNIGSSLFQSCFIDDTVEVDEMYGAPFKEKRF